MAVPIGVPGVGVWGRVEGGGGVGFPLENKGKGGKGGGRAGGWIGTGKGTGKSMRKLCRNYPLAIYPLVSPLKFARKLFQQGFSDSHSLLEFSDKGPFRSASPKVSFFSKSLHA